MTLAASNPSRLFRNLGNIELESSPAFLEGQQAYLRESITKVFLHYDWRCADF
jgi:hypothetical protein